MKRVTALVAAFGLSTGLGLGITGIASAVDAPTPVVKQQVHPGKGLGLGHRPLKGFKHSGGLVTKVTDTSLTVVGPRGTRTVGLDATTQYFVGKDAKAKSVLRVGQVVRVKLADPAAANPVATRVVVLPARLAGVVTKVEGDTLTITDHDGFTRVIKGRSTAKVGDVVVATGTVAPDGTTLDATDVRVGFAKKQKKD